MKDRLCNVFFQLFLPNIDQNQYFYCQWKISIVCRIFRVSLEWCLWLKCNLAAVKCGAALCNVNKYCVYTVWPNSTHVSQVLESFHAHILSLMPFPLNSKQYFHKTPYEKDLALGIIQESCPWWGRDQAICALSFHHGVSRVKTPSQPLQLQPPFVLVSFEMKNVLPRLKWEQ